MQPTEIYMHAQDIKQTIKNNTLFLSLREFRRR